MRTVDEQLASASRELAREFARDGALARDAESARTVVRSVLPVDKLAFGVAVGTASGLLIFLATAARLLLDPEGRTDLSPLANYFAGYSESWIGAAVGAAWGFGVGAVGGWFAAFVRNLTLAVWLFTVRTRAELVATRDFLDHV